MNWHTQARATAKGINFHDVPDEIAILVHMGYGYRVTNVVEILDPSAHATIFRIHGEVFEMPPATDFDPLSQRGPENIVRTHTYEVIIRDDLSTSSDTITYS